MPCIIGKNSITCYRGGAQPKPTWTGMVQDRQDNIWFVDISKEEFDKAAKVDVFTKDGETSKKFMKEFLEWVD